MNNYNVIKHSSVGFIGEGGNIWNYKRFMKDNLWAYKTKQNLLFWVAYKYSCIYKKLYNCYNLLNIVFVKAV